jgi:Membrane protease subunits, stomatin/prohibitin homologs
MGSTNRPCRILKGEQMTQIGLPTSAPRPETTSRFSQTRERPAKTRNGGGMLILELALLGVMIAIGITRSPVLIFAIGLPMMLALAFISFGFYFVQPNQGAVITLFGDYKGTDRTTGLRWVPFWYGRTLVSLRVRNVTSDKLKVNDKRGNPIEIAANVVWRVEDTAQATYDVNDYSHFVDIQIDTGLRAIASRFAYDDHEHGEMTLRADADEVGDRLRAELQERVNVAGISIDDARISHLAYAPEIASAMLRRQQAEAILAAREKIVQGAVEMVEKALKQLSERDVVQLDDDRRAAMVSNLLVVLCADREAQPVLNTGTLYG